MRAILRWCSGHLNGIKLCGFDLWLAYCTADFARWANARCGDRILFTVEFVPKSLVGGFNDKGMVQVTPQPEGYDRNPLLRYGEETWANSHDGRK